MRSIDDNTIFKKDIKSLQNFKTSSKIQENYKIYSLEESSLGIKRFSRQQHIEEQATMKSSSKLTLALEAPPEASHHCTAISAYSKSRSAKMTRQDTIITTTLQQQRQRQRQKQNISVITCDHPTIINSSCQRQQRHPPPPQFYKHDFHDRRSRRETALRQCRMLSGNGLMNQVMHESAKLIVLMLFIASIISTTSHADSSSDHQTNVASQETISGNKQHDEPKAEAISNRNVIIIKYANVTKDDQTQNQQQLNVFQLFNEPLSVSVIESKFSHSVQLFDVSQNQLSTLSKDLFCPLSNEVRQLNTSHNLLENFDCLGLISQAGQLCLSELRILDMSYNLIKHLPATGVATLHNLEVLNLSHNLIESLDELSLSSLFKLAKLDLSFNRIQQLPMRIFHKSSSMRVLRLQANAIQTNINQVLLSGLISLEEINLSFNNISHVSESAFLDKQNLTRVDLSHNQLNGLRQEALRITYTNVVAGGQSQRLSQQHQQPVFKPRLHHNGQFAGIAQVNGAYPANQVKQVSQLQVVGATEFLLSGNPFICDCHLEWMRKFQQTSALPPSQVRRSVLSNSLVASGRFSSSHYYDPNDPFAGSTINAQLMQNDQPTASVIQSSSSSSSSDTSSQTTSNISENSNNNSNSQANNGQQSSSNNNNQYYGRIADLDLIKCTPLFRRNAQIRQALNKTHAAPPSGEHHNQHHSMQVHHPNNHLMHHHHNNNNNNLGALSVGHQNYHQNNIAASSQMIDLLNADSSNFLCRYKSHCFALCHCCEFDACDCEMICPQGCNCYYDSSWQTNIIDCSANNHKVVPDRIPMDVSGLYLDGNNIDSLKPSNLIARKSLKTLFLNSSNLQYIANRTFNGLIELQTLYLNDNQLRRLNGHEFEPLAQLKALYLQSNRLDHISNQTFIYLRSLEILDLSNNRLTSMNFDLFVSIGHHNIRLRQLSIAHNWWSCQCSAIQTFRQILKQKFLINSGVQISDRHQLRCYYNSTTVGPLILDSASSGSGSGGSAGIQQPVFASFLPASLNQAKHQQQLTEINQCSESLDDSLAPESADFNPPVIQAPAVTPLISGDFSQQPPSQLSYNDQFYQQQDQQARSQQALGDQQQPMVNSFGQQQQTFYQSPNGVPVDLMGNPLVSGNAGVPRGPPHLSGPYIESTSGNGLQQTITSSSVPLTSFLFVAIIIVCMLIISISVFIFVRQQQRFRRHHRHGKSSTASTASVSSNASSAVISGVVGGGGSSGSHHLHQHKFSAQGTAVGQHQQYHTLHHHLIMGDNGSSNHVSAALGMPQQQQPQHHHSASSQSSNIYAALVSPTTGSSTIVTSSNANQAQTNGIFGSQHQPNNLHLYSNSSTTASSSSSQQQNNQRTLNGQAYRTTTAWQSGQQQQQVSAYGQHSQYYGHLNGLENPYAINASNLHAYSNKPNSQTLAHTNSLYNFGPPLPSVPPPASNCHEGFQVSSASDWIKLPKVKQFMSKLVNKSLALGGYRFGRQNDYYGASSAASCLGSDKIYDAFLSYDKRDEPFVMQHLAAELEYGQPQFRIADRFRDLPLANSNYMAEAISSVIGCSHRTILVLSENFLQSDWCRFELQAALRESSVDKQHKIIAIVLEPKCLLEMSGEMRSLLAGAGNNVSLYAANSTSQPSPQLVQLDSSQGGLTSTVGPMQVASHDEQINIHHQLIATLTGQSSNGNQQVSTTTSTGSSSRITYINYNERKFWPKLKQLMPVARPSVAAPATLQLTTKNC